MMVFDGKSVDHQNMKNYIHRKTLNSFQDMSCKTTNVDLMIELKGMSVNHQSH